MDKKQVILLILVLSGFVAIISMTVFLLIVDESPLQARSKEQSEVALVSEEEQALYDEEDSMNTDSSFLATVASAATVAPNTSAWIYPGTSACTAATEFTARKVAILKPEYFTLSYEGELELLTEEDYGCNGYSSANVAAVKSNSDQQLVTISGLYDGMRALVLSDDLSNAAVDTLVAFVVENDLSGIEIDFEDFGVWDAQMYTGYKTFITLLGNALHENDKLLAVDLPPVTGALDEGYYKLKYKDLATLPIDSFVIMAYDYQFDEGVGKAIAPNAWVKKIITYAKKYFPADKIVIGVPAYAYTGTTGSYDIKRITYAEAIRLKGTVVAKRDSLSSEMMFTIGRKSYVYVDAAGINSKIAFVKKQGISSVSIWALGGSAW